MRRVLMENFKRNHNRNESLSNMKNFQKENLALQADGDRTVVSKIERMAATQSLEMLIRLATTLEVDVSQLLHEHRG